MSLGAVIRYGDIELRAVQNPFPYPARVRVWRVRGGQRDKMPMLDLALSAGFMPSVYDTEHSMPPSWIANPLDTPIAPEGHSFVIEYELLSRGNGAAAPPDR